MEKVIFDYSKLRGRIKEIFRTQKRFAEAMEISPASISKKLTGKTYFNQQEMDRAVAVLGLDTGEITVYFFTRAIKIS